eukprot:2696138-Rhodomonas_salina.1
MPVVCDEREGERGCAWEQQCLLPSGCNAPPVRFTSPTVCRAANPLAPGRAAGHWQEEEEEEEEEQAAAQSECNTGPSSTPVT